MSLLFKTYPPNYLYVGGISSYVSHLTHTPLSWTVASAWGGTHVYEALPTTQLNEPDPTHTGQTQLFPRTLKWDRGILPSWFIAKKFWVHYMFMAREESHEENTHTVMVNFMSAWLGHSVFRYAVKYYFGYVCEGDSGWDKHLNWQAELSPLQLCAGLIQSAKGLNRIKRWTISSVRVNFSCLTALSWDIGLCWFSKLNWHISSTIFWTRIYTPNS